MANIIGRKNQVAELLHCYNSGKAEFVVLYGRRRVGKTYLVNEVFRDRFAFSHTGLAPFQKTAAGMMAERLQSFYFSLRHYGLEDCVCPKSWIEAFELLRRLLERKTDAERQVVFIDEMPWMDTPRAGFLTALEGFWNGWACNRREIMLIVCGSATSWIQNKLIGARGGLYNRITNQIKLQPFTLGESEELFKKMGLVLTRRDIVEAYMATGGIPYYLNYFRKGLSLVQNIDRLFFAIDAKLSDEFNRLFASLFTSPEEYRKIIEVLSTRHGGLSRDEILARTGMANGGGITTQLKALEESGFIRSYQPMGFARKRTLYQVVDNFCLFWLKFKTGKTAVTDPEFWQHNVNAPALNSWRGIAFENVCMVHIDQIKRALSIAGIATTHYSWIQRGDEATAGTQVDLVIDRADGVANLCEMKYTRGEFAIDHKYYQTLDNRIATFTQALPRRIKSVQLTMITASGLKANQYSGIVQSALTADALFS